MRSDPGVGSGHFFCRSPDRASPVAHGVLYFFKNGRVDPSRSPRPEAVRHADGSRHRRSESRSALMRLRITTLAWVVPLAISVASPDLIAGGRGGGGGHVGGGHVGGGHVGGGHVGGGHVG